MDYVMKDQVHQRSLEWPQDVPERKCRVLPSADNVLTLKNHVKIKMVDHEASGSCLLAGSWWIGSSSFGQRKTVKLAGPASWWAVGEHPHQEPIAQKCQLKFRFIELSQLEFSSKARNLTKFIKKVNFRRCPVRSKRK